jgi:hypothetical protein
MPGTGHATQAIMPSANDRAQDDAKYLKMALSFPFEQAQRWFCEGILDATDWEIYQFVWRNSAPRFSDIAERYQVRSE